MTRDREHEALDTQRLHRAHAETGAAPGKRTHPEGLTGPTSVKLSSSFAPVVNAGFTYNFTEHWSAAFSVSYMWLKSRGTLETKSAVGTIKSESKIKLDPVVTFLSVGYKF